MNFLLYCMACWVVGEVEWTTSSVRVALHLDAVDFTVSTDEEFADGVCGFLVELINLKLELLGILTGEPSAFYSVSILSSEGDVGVAVVIECDGALAQSPVLATNTNVSRTSNRGYLASIAIFSVDVLSVTPDEVDSTAAA
jgi:hypothetical protein